LGYFFFYLRFAQKEIVSELRKNLKETQKQFHHINNELDEHLQQNIILREKVTELLEKNTDLTKIVSELSRYYYHIKVGAEKVQELSEYLKLPDQSLSEKINHYAPDAIPNKQQIVVHQTQSISDKKF
jgi:predicted nuclease with TOPRIM domain